jgi:hypothetical protein
MTNNTAPVLTTTALRTKRLAVAVQAGPGAARRAARTEARLAALTASNRKDA